MSRAAREEVALRILLQRDERLVEQRRGARRGLRAGACSMPSICSAMPSSRGSPNSRATATASSNSGTARATSPRARCRLPRSSSESRAPYRSRFARNHASASRVVASLAVAHLLDRAPCRGSCAAYASSRVSPWARASSRSPPRAMARATAAFACMHAITAAENSVVPRARLAPSGAGAPARPRTTRAPPTTLRSRTRTSTAGRSCSRCSAGVVLARPRERGADVVELALHAREPWRPRRRDPVRLRLHEQRRDVLGVSPAQRGLLVAHAELSPRRTAARSRAACSAPSRRPRASSRVSGRRAGRARRARSASAARRSHVASAASSVNPPPNTDSRSSSAAPRVRAARSSSPSSRAASGAAGSRCGCRTISRRKLSCSRARICSGASTRDACGGQLDRERQPSSRRQISAIVAALRRIDREARHARPARARRTGGSHRTWASFALGVARRQRERRHQPRALAGERERFAAGREHLQRGARAQQRFDEPRRARRSRARSCRARAGVARRRSRTRDRLAHVAARRPACPSCSATCCPSTRGTPRRRRARSSCAPPDLSSHGLDRQPRLAATAGARQRQEARRLEQPPDLGDLALAPDEGRQRHGHLERQPPRAR